MRWVGAAALVAMLLGVGVGADAKDCSNATLLPVDTTWAGDGPVHNDCFMPMAAAAPARHTLRGSLMIPALKLSGAHQGCAGAIADEARLRAELDLERRLETPVKPWSALPATTQSPWLDAFDGSAAPDDVSASGLVIDGVLYVTGCHTRSGPYPYCRHMRHGAFSVTKSLGAAVALLRLAAKHGDGVFDVKISDYVAVTATHDGWKDTTFADALSTVVPIGDAGPRRDWPQPDPDDHTPKFFGWMQRRTAREKLDVGFTYGKYPWARGEVVRYSTVVTFTLAAAVDVYLKRKEGPNAHLWDMVVDEVYRPIGIFHAPTMHTLER